MRTIKLIAPLAVGVALLAGCTSSPAAPATNGMENLDADAIAQASADALEQAGSFRVRGEGEDDDGSTIEVDLRYADENIQGTMSLSGTTLNLLAVDGVSYLKADGSFWEPFLGEEAAVVLPLLADKWVVMPGSQDLFDEFQAEDLLTPEGELTKGEVTTVDGQQAIALESSTGGTLYVALTGEPYPIKLVNDDREMLFTEIGDEITIEAPDESDVFDLSAFTG